MLAGVQSDVTTARSPLIVFLTDGVATQGTMGQDDILASVRDKNEGEVPIFSLAFGESADYELVRRIALQNGGLGRRIYEASDAATQIAGFYNEISVTLLCNVTFSYLDVPVSNVTRQHFPNYFQGSEIVISGKYDSIQGKTLGLEVAANGGYTFQDQLSASIMKVDLKPDDAFETITEKVWAYLTIKQLLNKEEATSEQDEKDAFKEKVMALALKVYILNQLVFPLVKSKESNVQTLNFIALLLLSSVYYTLFLLVKYLPSNFCLCCATNVNVIDVAGVI